MGILLIKFFKREIPFSKQRKAKGRPKEVRSCANLLGNLKRFQPEKVGSSRNFAFGGIVKNYSLLWKRKWPKGKLEKRKLSGWVVFRGG